MAREKGKYVRLPIDFTREEYERLRAYAQDKRCFMSAFVRDCVMDVLDEPLHAVKRGPVRPPARSG